MKSARRMVLYAHRMQLPPQCVMAGTLGWIAIGAAAFFVFSAERQLTDRRSAQRAFDARARETVDAAVDLRAAQQAYVAAGQGVPFWVAKVATTGDVVRDGIRSLKRT